MSWLTEIAGKAEDLLNKVDQTAATALQNKSKLRTSSGGFGIRASKSQSHIASFETVDRKIPPTTPVPSSSRKSVTEKTPSYNSVLRSPRKKPESDDEKLFRFLNSTDPMPSTKTDKSLSPGKKSSVNPSVDAVQSSQNLESKASANSEASSSVDTVTETKDEKLSSIHPEPLLAGNSLVDDNQNEDSYSTSEKIADGELQQPQKKPDHRSTGSENYVLHEADLLAALDAKDSQLAVLKIRLQESDQELKSKCVMLGDLKAENDRIVKEYADGATFQNKTIESLREQLHNTETELVKAKEALLSAQTERMNYRSKVEEEQRHLSDSYTGMQKKWMEVNEKNKELMVQLKLANSNVDSVQQEYTDYKYKAQRILQSKERLITSLKEGDFDSEKMEKSEASSSLLSAEIESIKQERDLIKEELRHANELVETYRNEVQDLEKMAQSDLSSSQEKSRTLKDQLETEKIQREETQLLNNQLKEELQFIRDDFTRTKAGMQSRIQDREIEIEKLRRQLTAKSLSTISQDELESRLHALTENLIQKQTLVEALSTEKNSLVLQLERLEQQLKETQQFGSQHHTYIGMHNNEPERKPRAVLLENPFDSSLTRKVKKVYGTIDAFSIRLGVFFRRYPISRVFLIIYMLILHFWVMVVLLTYEPEVHSALECSLQTSKKE